MKTIELYTGCEIMMFHIGRGGTFNSQGHLSFKGSERIDECYDWSEQFIHDTDESGKLLPEEEWILLDSNGNEIMDSKELRIALNTGIGTLNIDGDYDTTYTTYLKDVSEEEYLLLDEDWERAYLIVVNNIPEEKLDNILEDEYIDNMYYYEYKD